MNQPKVIVVLPAYNAASTLEKTLHDLPMEYVSELVLVDDNSRDGTVSLALSLKEKIGKPCTIHLHDKNLGYGGNQKTCYRLALDRGADIVVMLHPDYQYDPKLVKYFVEFIRDGYFDVMLGSRIRSRQEALEGGMPPYKYIANRALTLFENIVSGQNLSEWHTGMRAYSRKVLERVDFSVFSNDYIFDTQMLFTIVKHGFRMGDIPVPVRYFKDASSINFRRSVLYGIRTVWEAFKYFAWRTTRREKWIMLGVFLVCLCMLAYSLPTLTTKPRIWSDEAKSIEIARSLAFNGTLDIETAPGVFTGFPELLQSTGYPVTAPLATLYRIFGVSFSLARLYMLAWLLAAALSTYFFLRNFMDKRLAFLGLFLLSTFASFYANGRTVTGEIPGFAFLLWALYAWLELENFYLAGFLAGVAAVAKPSVFVLALPALALSLALQGRGFWKRLGQSIVGFLPPGLVAISLLLLSNPSGALFSNIITLYKNPFTGIAGSNVNYSSDILTNVYANLSNFFHTQTLVYFGALFFVLLTVRALTRLGKVATLYDFTLVYTVFAFIYYLRSPGWLRYILIAELLILSLLPHALFQVFSFLQEKISFTRRLGALRLAIIVIVFLAFVQTYHLLTSAEIYSDHGTLTEAAYLDAVYPQTLLVSLGDITLYALLHNPNRSLVADFSGMPLLGNNPLLGNDLPEIVVVPLGDYPFLGTSTEMLVRSYTLVSAQNTYAVYKRIDMREIEKSR